MLPKFHQIVDDFASLDEQTRLELLLDYAKKLPALPDRFVEARDAGINKVPECLTPVFMFSELDGDRKMRLYIDVAEESPTVRGLMSVIVAGCDGEPPADVIELPKDLLLELGLHQCIGAQRTVGLGAIIDRIRRDAKKLTDNDATHN